MTTIVDLERLAAATPTHAPFDYLVVPGFIRADALAEVMRDFPALEGPRNHEVEGTTYGPAFGSLLAELEDERFLQLLGDHLGVESLAALPRNVTVRGFCETSDGNIHTDHWSKVVTALLYPNAEWRAPGGRLRLLRSDTSLDDYLEEVSPGGGTLVAFRRSDRSFHGHAPHEGERRVVQVSWLRRSPVARVLQGAARRGTHWMKRLGLHPDKAGSG